VEPRLRLDIALGDLAFGLAACGGRHERRELERRIEARFAGELAGGGAAGALVTLSARSALDAALACVDWPSGSEVLCSALNVPDMARVIEEHGFRCVPVDVDLATLAPRRADVEARATAATRALLVAHLFGGRAPVDALFREARGRGWFVIEDAAQAFAGSHTRAHRDADLTLFSFGPIKTATALGGGVARVRDEGFLQRMRAHVSGWPRAPRTRFARRVVQSGALLALTRPTPYGALVRALERSGDLEARLAGLVRGFPPERLFTRLRARPCTAQLALLDRRLSTYDDDTLERRRSLGESVRERLAGAVELAGAATHDRTHWLLPILVDAPDALARHLRAHGFDTTRRATLAALGPRPGHPTPNAERFVDRVLYLPVDPRSSSGAVERRTELVRQHATGARSG